jgi:hypothetical protein
MAIASDGTVYIAWGGSNYHSTDYLYFRTRHTDGTWSHAHDIVNNLYAPPMYADNLLLANDGTVHLLWHGLGQYPQHSVRSPKGVWSAPITLPYALNPRPAVALDSQGVLHLIGRSLDPTLSFAYRQWRPASGQGVSKLIKKNEPRFGKIAVTKPPITKRGSYGAYHNSQRAFRGNGHQSAGLTAAF